MSSIFSLLYWILLGDFGLLTLTPRYLLGVLFPVMTGLGFLSAFLTRLPFLRKPSPLVNQLFYGISGLGCTTAAFALCQSVEDQKMHRRLLWLLILLVPCSSQLAIIVSFGAIVTLRVFLSYLAFTSLFMAAIYSILSKVYPLTSHLSPPSVITARIRPLEIIKEAFLSVMDTVPSFCIGSIIISVLLYCGTMDGICDIFAPFLQRFLQLPREAVSLFLLNLFKRDYGSASLLSFAETGAFDGIQLVVVMMMLTFCPPCFNSTILLYKQEKLPIASFIWLGSFLISILLGRVVSQVLLICAV